MHRFTNPERLEIIQKYYRNNGSVARVEREFTLELGRHHQFNKKQIRRTVNKLEREFTLLDIKPPTRMRTGRSEENIAAVAASVQDDPNESIRHRSAELGLSRMTTQRILRLDLGLHPYKIVLTQKLLPEDHGKRREFADWALQMLAADPDFGQKIIFSDEANFYLSGHVNKQNCRYWAAHNPQQTEEVVQYPKKLNVWCGLWHGGIIGPYFFRNEEGNTVTTNGPRYRAMLEEFLWPELDNIDITDMWFQQDGATSHTCNATLEVVRERFGDWIITKRAFINWPPRSCDLTPLDYFLWGYVKSLVYANKPATLDALENNIRVAIGAVTPQMLDHVIQNWTTRLQHCQRSRGGHLPDILFHT